MILCTTIFKTDDQQRRDELRFCLEANLQNSAIEKMHIFVERMTEEEMKLDYNIVPCDRIVVHDIHFRPTYGDFFAYCNEYLKEKICVISNVDIYFDESVALIPNYLPDNQTLLCISRYNSVGDGEWAIQGGGDSHDVWVFRSPLGFSGGGDIYVGVPGCDSYLAARAKLFGVKLVNPCLKIKAFHKHASSDRDYGDFNHAGLWYWSRPDYDSGFIVPFSE